MISSPETMCVLLAKLGFVEPCVFQSRCQVSYGNLDAWELILRRVNTML